MDDGSSPTHLRDANTVGQIGDDNTNSCDNAQPRPPRRRRRTGERSRFLCYFLCPHKESRFKKTILNVE